MPPDEVGQLVAIDFKLQEGRLVGEGKRVYPSTDHLRVSWYSGRVPRTYRKICDGVAYVKKSTMQNLDNIPEALPTNVRGRYAWRDTAGQYGVMVIMVLPAGYTIVNPKPLPEEAKSFQDRVALFWILWPPKDKLSKSVEISWGLKSSRKKLDTSVEEINDNIRQSRQRNKRTEYDVALSFAAENRAYVEQVAMHLRNAGISVFYDRYEQVTLVVLS